MGSSVRVNLSLPPDLAAVVSEVAQKTGRSMAGVVMEALAYRLPHFRAWLFEANHEALFPPKRPFPEPELEPVLEGKSESLSPAQLVQRHAEHNRRRQAAIKRERKKERALASIQKDTKGPLSG